MEIIIAGFNIDSELIATIDGNHIATPETISAAYARISRSSKSVDELRKSAHKEVAKARASNDKIIFDMGHSSIAEHAVFNIDIIGISRYLTEFIQKTRLASFTEKSQRYVTLKGDFVLPEELKNTPLENRYKVLIQQQNDFYEKAYQLGKEFLEKHNFSGTKSELEGKAKEDARYCLAMATQTQMGMTINARSLARLLKRLDKIELSEAQEIKKVLEDKVKQITPSLLRYTTADLFEKVKLRSETAPLPLFKMLSLTENADEMILAAMLFEQSGRDFEEILKDVLDKDNWEKEKMYAQVFQNIKSYHSVPRCFELVNALFQVPMSSSCFAQWKRHRLSTILKADYHPQNGYVTPALFYSCNLDNEFMSLQDKVARFYHELELFKKGLGGYILTNSHKLVILFQANLRELYHFSRLRSDKHAQWEIRQLSRKMDSLLKSKLNFAGNYLMGKDEMIK